MTREAHLQWCKDRANEYLTNGDVTKAIASMCSDMQKHEGTQNHAALLLMLQLQMAGNLSTADDAKRFIDGFN